MAYIGKGLDNGVRNRFIYSSTQGQTAFTGSDLDGKTLTISDALYTDVYHNGVKIKLTTDWSSSTTTMTLVTGASVNDVIEIISFDVFGVPNTVPSFGGTFTGAISATSYGAVSGTTGTFSGNVGIGNSSPRAKVDVNGSIYTEWSDTNFIGMQFGSDPSGYRLGLLPISSTRDLQIQAKSSDAFSVSGITLHTGTGPTERLRITSDGRGLSQFTAKAWVNFNGTGTLAIRDSHNVSSVTDNGTGNYTVNFTNNMANTNYSAVANSNGSSGWTVTDSHAVGSLRTLYYNSGGIDTSEINVQVFGD